jgi:hypothetical protein
MNKQVIFFFNFKVLQRKAAKVSAVIGATW